MELQKIEKIVIEATEEFACEHEVTLDSRLTEDLAFESLDTVELALNLEDQFGIEIPDEIVEKFITVKEITEYVNRVKGDLVETGGAGLNDALRNLNTDKQEALDGSPSIVNDEAGFIHVKFQCGPIKEHGVNGTSIENVLDLLAIRLKGFQKGPFACETNARAISHIEAAMASLEERTAKRTEQGVEGTNQEHKE